MYSALLWRAGSYREANFIPALIMSFLMTGCPTLEHTPPGRGELSVFRGEHVITGLWESEPRQMGEIIRGSPGCFLGPSVREFFIGCH